MMNSISLFRLENYIHLIVWKFEHDVTLLNAMIVYRVNFLIMPCSHASHSLPHFMVSVVITWMGVAWLSMAPLKALRACLDKDGSLENNNNSPNILPSWVSWKIRILWLAHKVGIPPNLLSHILQIAHKQESHVCSTYT
jgi:hypothetical protein